MINTDYNVKALGFLLCKDCLSERYYPLIGYKDILSASCAGTKSRLSALSDEELVHTGISPADIPLLRRFLAMYDPSPAKMREIDSFASDHIEAAAFRELYLLPGVRHIRAHLYFISGYSTLRDISLSSADEIIDRTSRAISESSLDCTAPLPKEARTHIAVAKAFLLPLE